MPTESGTELTHPLVAQRDALVGQRAAQQHLQARPQRRDLVLQIDQLVIGLVGDLPADGGLDVELVLAPRRDLPFKLQLVHQPQVTALGLGALGLPAELGHQDRGDHRGPQRGDDRE